MSDSKKSAVEKIKEESSFLRGTIEKGLGNLTTGAFSDSDQQLLKFHGMYQQDDRDIRSERRKYKLEKAFSFMLRIRVPGGKVSPSQWLKTDAMASKFGNETLKLTTRQAFQLHGIIKSNLKSLMREIQAAAMDTIAACGDVNRNVMSSANPLISPMHSEVLEYAQRFSDHLTPQTNAYAEIWLDGEKVNQEQETEPIYGKVYLPRKFKIAVAIPPSNDVDVFAHDLSFIAIVEAGELQGFNIVAGGGMGMTHGQEKTYPRVGDIIGFVRKEKAVDLAEKVVLVQKDFGDREDRKHARLKYTIDTYGLEWFQKKLEEYLGYSLEKPKPFVFSSNGDVYGWEKGSDGQWHFALFVEGGRVLDKKDFALRTALRKIAKMHQGHFYLTPNQNLIIANVSDQEKPKMEELLKEYGLEKGASSALRGSSLACVALPTCGLALAEAERYLPHLINDLEEVVNKVGLENEAINIRMTGCPNGCTRPYLAEIALVGRSSGKYHLFLGGSFLGNRLAKLFKPDCKDTEIVETLKPLISQYAKERNTSEKFGDFLVRAGIVGESQGAKDFHI